MKAITLLATMFFVIIDEDNSSVLSAIALYLTLDPIYNTKPCLCALSSMLVKRIPMPPKPANVKNKQRININPD